MRWDDTEASACRYGEIAERIFGDGEVIWESSEANYQGWANVLVHMPDGTFVHYEWSYGSCSYCDEWEAADLTDDQVEQEMRNGMAVLPDVETLRRYLHLTEEFENACVPTTSSPDNGGIAGMLRTLSAGSATDFQSMACAAQKWLYENGR